MGESTASSKQKKKEKINRNTIPEGFTLGLAIYDAFPVLFFGISVILLGVTLKSAVFVLGAALCLWAGMTKVIWKIIVVMKRKNIWWMFMQMRICMPIGFVLMIVGGVLCRGKANAGEMWEFASSFPVAAFFLIGFAGLFLMGVAAAKLDSADAKSNWIEQTINTVAQLSILIGVLLLMMSVGYYHAGEKAKTSLMSDESVIVEVTDDQVVFRPAASESDTGLIFYPGGKVEYLAYTPLMKEIAKEGVTCVLVKMPLNYAFMGSNRADQVISSFTEIEHWYLAGHSLGGAFGAIYAAKNPDKLDGVILLGAYSTKSLSGLKVLSVYGSEDGVLSMDKYEKYRSNLPADLTELVIKGGNHAMFGDYGKQDGDGLGQISMEEQWGTARDAIIGFIESQTGIY